MKQLYRRFFPRLRNALLDGSFYLAPDDTRLAAAYARVATDDDFTRLRFEEGRRWRGVLAHYGKFNVLDVGGGNGAIELAVRADPRFRAVSVEMLWNDDARRLGVRRVVADAAALPFRGGAFDAVTCLETIEHLRDARAAGAEVARVTREDGVLLVTTPPRWRYAIKPDPHFGIRFLALLPPRWQRAVAAKRGFAEEHHYVDRLYGSVRQIAKLFPRFALQDVLTRSRAPRRWFWDALVFRRTASAPG